MASIIRVDDLQDSGGNSILSSNGSGTFSNNLGVANTPAFLATMTSNQTVANNTYATVACNNEVLDSNGCYDTSTYKFTPNVAGYYFLSGSGRFDGTGGDNEYRMQIFKNADSVSQVMTEWLSQEVQSIVSGVHYANGSSDFFQFKVRQSSGGNATFNGGTWESTSEIARFFGFKLIGA
tara:strand:- start:211 stop:747 length:537 start_codon:yes stop_codon:yes gene_type:complete